MTDDSAMEEDRLKKRMPMRYWCVAHQRLAQATDRCDPNLGGTMIPCKTLWGPFTADDSEMEEGRMEEIEAMMHPLMPDILRIPPTPDEVLSLLAEVRRLRAENEDLRKRLSALQYLGGERGESYL